MTIAADTARVSYAGNGSIKIFAYTFKIFDEDDLRVTLVLDADESETPQTKTTHYTVTGVGAAGGGTVVMVTAPANGETLVIERIMGVIQQTDLRNQGTFLPQTHEDQFDKLTMIMQQFEELLATADLSTARVILLPIGAVSGSSAFDALSNRIKNVDDPVADQDAATKKYSQEVHVKIYTTAGRPTADATTEGRIIYVRDTNNPGQFQFCCQRATAGQYDWIPGPTGKVW